MRRAVFRALGRRSCAAYLQHWNPRGALSLGQTEHRHRQSGVVLPPRNRAAASEITCVPSFLVLIRRSGFLVSDGARQRADATRFNVRCAFMDALPEAGGPSYERAGQHRFGSSRNRRHGPFRRFTWRAWSPPVCTPRRHRPCGGQERFGDRLTSALDLVGALKRVITPKPPRKASVEHRRHRLLICNPERQSRSPIAIAARSARSGPRHRVSGESVTIVDRCRKRKCRDRTDAGIAMKRRHSSLRATSLTTRSYSRQYCLHSVARLGLNRRHDGCEIGALLIAMRRVAILFLVSLRVDLALCRNSAPLLS